MTTRVAVAHAGKQHAYRHALALQRLGMLERFITSGYYKMGSFPDRLFHHSPPLHRFLSRRYQQGLDEKRVARRWDLEVPEYVARVLFGNGALAERFVCHRDATFDRWVARRWASRGDVYWGFQGSCLTSLKAARQAGVIAVAEFATAHITAAVRILSREQERHPEWADSISNLNFPDWYRRRLEREPQEADYCIAASSFTKRTLQEAGIAGGRIKLLPLGVDLGNFVSTPRRGDGPFRVLFVGGVGQRKGIKYLLEAYRQVRTKNTELVLVGPLVGSGRALQRYSGGFTYLGRLDQAAVVRQMQECHVLVLPSVFEGFGLVIPEAMATGMPVIASTHTAAPDFVVNGKEGFVLEPDDVEGLAAKLDLLASDRHLAAEMGKLAAERAQAFSWEAHQHHLRALLATIATPHPAGVPA